MSASNHSRRLFLAAGVAGAAGAAGRATAQGRQPAGAPPAPRPIDYRTPLFPSERQE